MSGEKQVPTAMNANAGVKSSSSAATPAGIIPKERVDATAEPSFSPNPGLFDADTEVTLHCSMQNAIIRYTVDGSQPTSSSPIYRAPIMVKGTALTIKAFAGGSGLRDSAVVTGIFRIE
jgi:endoglucanase